MLASDPHLGSSVPSVWYLVGLHRSEDEYIVGPSLPGVPFVCMGKTKYLHYAITAHLADVADLYRETVNPEKTKYKVDGQWRDLIIENHEFKMKDGTSVKKTVYRTHRGPLITTEDTDAASVLFGGSLPKISDGKYYSLKWAGDEPYENVLTMQKQVYQIKTADEFFSAVDKLDTFYSIPAQLAIAFENGDIAGLTLATAPIRNNSHPYKGCMMLDGTTTAHDWIGYKKVKDLPRIKNPRKGYLVNANNRLSGDFVVDDFGNTITSTGRAQRMTELIET